MVALTVIVRRISDDDEIGILVSRSPIKRGGQIEIFFGQVFFDVVVLYR